MPKYRGLEIWTDYACNSGVRKAFLPAAQTCEEVESLLSEESLVFSMVRDTGARWVAETIERRVAVVRLDDNSAREFRILRISEGRVEGQGVVLRVECQPPTCELARVPVQWVDSAGGVHSEWVGSGLTIAEHLSQYILPWLTSEGITYFSAGTIDPTGRYDLVYGWQTPLELLQQLASMAGCEFRLRQNGTTDYKLDFLTAVGSSAAALRVRLGRNLVGLQRQRSSVEQANRVYVKGQGADNLAGTMRHARWRVATVPNTTDITLEDPLGGEGPIAYDDQFNGELWFRKAGTTGSWIGVSDTILSTQRLNGGAVHGLAIGDSVEFALSSSGKEMTYVQAPSALRLAYGGTLSKVLSRPDLPEAVNLVPNAVLKNWSAGLPVSWSKVGTPTVTQVTTTDRWVTGGSAARVQSTADGQGLECAAQTIAPTAARPYGNCVASVLVDSGQIRVELVAGSKVFPQANGDGPLFSEATGVYSDYEINGIDLNGAGATSLKVRIVQHGDTAADFYIDRAQMSQEAGVEPFVEYNGGTLMWQAANQELLESTQPLARYDLSLRDLQRAGVSAANQVTLGQTCVVDYPELGVSAVSSRILEVRRNWLRSLETTVTMSNRPEDVSDVIVGRAPPSRQRQGLIASPFLDVSIAVADSPSVYGVRQLQFFPNNAGATVYYCVQDQTATVPNKGDAAWIPYNATAGNALSVDCRGTYTVSKRVSAYCTIGNYTSPVRSVRLRGVFNTNARVSLVEYTPLSVKYTAYHSEDWARCFIYARKSPNYPTQDGLSTGIPDPTYLVAELVRDQSASGRTKAGTAIPGGFVYNDTTSWVNGDTILAMFVFVDPRGRQITTAFATTTISNAGHTFISSIVMQKVYDGTACGDPLKVAVAPTWPGTAPSATDQFTAFAYYDNQLVSAPVEADPRKRSLTSITRTASTATVTYPAAHNRSTGDWIYVTGAAQAEYNGFHQVESTPTATTLTYFVTGTPATPATGTLEAVVALALPLVDTYDAAGPLKEFFIACVYENSGGTPLHDYTDEAQTPFTVNVSGSCG